MRLRRHYREGDVHTRENIDPQVLTEWFIKTLQPQMHVFHAPRSVAVLDGAGFHDITTLVAAAEKHGVWVLTCAPMRPQDNAIVMKQQLIQGNYTGFEADAVHAINLALASITPDMRTWQNGKEAKKCFAPLASRFACKEWLRRGLPGLH